uniref:non-specific serine/threonine protein kinase n=1 Tax=Phallusia mammillata TaxID=59560 RepID=A0A6F9DPI1_9ASCI|nr:serine/threonine-protein kinase par-1-like [Phallusia mammillata]
MYCTIAPPTAQGLLSSHSGHFGLPTQLGLVRVQSSCSSSGSGSESAFAQQSQTLIGTNAKYTVIGTDDLALQLAGDRTRAKFLETGSNCERRTRAPQHCDSSSAPPSVLSAYHSSSSSSGNSSPTSFYSLPNHDLMSHLHSSGATRPESPVVVVAGAASAQQHRPSTRYHHPAATASSPIASPTTQKSMFLNWKNNNVGQTPRPNEVSTKNNSLTRATTALGLSRQCNNDLSSENLPRSKSNFCVELSKQTKTTQSKRPQVPPKCEKVIEMLKSKARKSNKTRAEMNIKNNNCPPQGAAVAPSPVQPTARKEQNKSASVELNAKKSFLETYDVLGVIGVGGGGMVYAGTRTTDNHPVAIKRIMREKVKRWERIQGRTVPQEIALMIRVNGHQGIIRLLDWYECLDSFILILERPASSVDLFDYIREVGRMNEKEACMIFRQILTAVYHIHTRGVVHRDIKDENIVLNRDTGEAKLIDFGCGTLIHEHPYRDFSGTPEFYPPEWFNEHYYNARTAAIWSLGVLLFDMLCGEIPFKSKTKIAQGKFDFKGNVSSEAKHLITWMLSFKPESRPTLVDIMQHPWIGGKKF